jgi:hypothetical protein
MAAFDTPKNPLDVSAPLGQHSKGVEWFKPPTFQPTYANLATIQSLINSVQSNLISLQQQLVSAMDGLALPVTISDTTLAAAVAQTWPIQLGSPPNYVTFNYYNYLLGHTSTAATIITNAYLAAAQNVGGNDAIDLLPVVQVLIAEVGYVNGFITNNLSGGIVDSSEQRIAELFQDLLTSLNTQVQNAQNVFQNQGVILSSTETAQLSQGDAQNAQALFQVNLNKLNIQLNQNIHTLNTNFASSAAVFYSQFLEPALQFRQNVASQMLPIYSGVLGSVLNSSIDATNQNLHSALVDQQSRIQFLANQVDTIMTDIINRDSFRNWIDQLSTHGVPVPSGVSGVMIQATDSPAALTFFSEVAAGGVIPSATPSFNADHLKLDNTLNLQCHPQYLTITDYNSATPAWYSDTDSGGGTLDLSNYVTTSGISLTDTSTNDIFISEYGPANVYIKTTDGGSVHINSSSNLGRVVGGINYPLSSGLGINPGEVYISSASGIGTFISDDQGIGYGIALDAYQGNPEVSVARIIVGGALTNGNGVDGSIGTVSTGGLFISDTSTTGIVIAEMGSGQLSIEANAGGPLGLGGTGGISIVDDSTTSGIRIQEQNSSDIDILQQGSGSINLQTTSADLSVQAGAGGVSGNLRLEAFQNILITATSAVNISGAQMGFYGQTPISRPTVTGSRGGNAALTSLITSLASLGLIIDSTT